MYQITLLLQLDLSIFSCTESRILKKKISLIPHTHTHTHTLPFISMAAIFYQFLHLVVVDERYKKKDKNDIFLNKKN